MLRSKRDANMILLGTPRYLRQRSHSQNGTPLALALSGGGLRATLFELGILLYLAKAGELKNVSVVVSVSGGSILAAHLATHWKQVTQDRSGFIEVAADLIRFVRSNIRNSAMIGWLWWHAPLISFAFRSWQRPVFFLEREYKKHFAETTLGQLPSGDGIPQFVFVATDTKKYHRVALTRAGIFRFNFAGESVEQPILANGVHLSLAVAASSCFPPVFEVLPLTYRELGLRYNEFDGSLNLRDGGVSGNLGVEVLTGLMKHEVVVAMRLLVCDAECGLAEEPSDGPLAVVDVQGAALSDAARQIVHQLGSNALLLRFASRPPEEFGLSFRVLTKLSNYRTDLDQPTWEECYALMVHGAAVCEQALSAKVSECPTREQVRKAVQEVLKAAGCPEELPEPTEAALRGCGRRSYWRVGVHALTAVLTFLIVCGIASEAAAYVYPSWSFRPLRAVWRFIVPEPIVDRNIDTIAADLATAVCQDSVTKVEANLVDGHLSRVVIIVGLNSSGSTVYFRKAVRPPKCDHDVDCEFTFRGQFAREKLHPGDAATVIGRIIRISATEQRLNAYIDFEECYAERTRAVQGRGKQTK